LLSARVGAGIRDAPATDKGREAARHSAATLLLGRGGHPKIVSEMLRHSTVAITLDVYSHVTPSMHREAARAMDSIFG